MLSLSAETVMQQTINSKSTKSHLEKDGFLYLLKRVIDNILALLYNINTLNELGAIFYECIDCR